MYRWYNELKRGRLTLGDEYKSGRPLTAVTQENMLAVKKLISMGELRIRRFNKYC